ncbi:hypothetical protein MY4824_007328 [Beauveria thailandica]
MSAKLWVYHAQDTRQTEAGYRVGRITAFLQALL